MSEKPLILWGGTDISPHHYNEPAQPETDTPDHHRDTAEFLAVISAIEQGKPVIGVCRGAQLLCVVNGGKLLQHIPEHRNNSHRVDCKDIFDEGSFFTPVDSFDNVAADHHQVMVPSGNHIVIGTAPDGVPEVVYWPDTKCLAIQPHPEWMNKDHPFNIWVNELIFNLFGLKGVF